MRNRKIIIFLMAILPWLTVPIIGKKIFSRFLPGAISMAIYLIFEGILATKRKWWWFPFNMKPNILGELPLIFGPFFVGSIWILKYTYKKFNLYLLVNIIVDSFFTFFLIDWFKKIGYVTLVRINRFQLSLIFLIKSFVMYGFQVFYDKFIKNETAYFRE